MAECVMGPAGDERACTRGRAACAPNFAAPASAALAAPSCSVAGFGSGFTSFDLAVSTSSAAAFVTVAAFAADFIASASRHRSSFSEALALAFALAAPAACLAWACSFAAAAILATRAAASGDAVFSAVCAELATISTVLRW